MEKRIICSRVIDFGEVSFTSEKKVNSVTVKIELRKCGGEETFTISNGKRVPTGISTPEYVELAICGDVWNSSHTDIVMGGQCLDELKEFHLGELFDEIYSLWKKYHLNGMNAGTPEQMECFANHPECKGYNEQCELLFNNGLLTVNFTGMTVGRVYENEPYKYGTGWVVNALPESVISRVKEICNS